MITDREINECKLSPTKKDFYQIWNELLDTASKLSERWDPTSTNESDPGIVLLKVLTAVADKLNVEMDLNTLECFMPSCAQEESMRKLTEMMGYSMRYYQSATTQVQISYDNTKKAIDQLITIDRFTNIKNSEDSINYVTTHAVTLNGDNTSKIVDCIEGELVECESDDNNIISIGQLSNNNRYYLPEAQIAENGIFVTNVDNDTESEEWQKVDSLNTAVVGTKVWKFGYDSRQGLPYIQFPDDISTLIEDGLKIKYVRTNGVYGNISVGTLSKMEKPSSWTEEEDYFNETNYRVKNIKAAQNGKNLESINDAYNSYKKTIGTFDTLVTCRDYINKIYQMTLDGNTPLVSNIVVSDINSDINKAYTLCSFDKSGIIYKNKAVPGGLSCFDLVLYPFKTVYGTNSKLEYTKSFKYDDEHVPEILLDLENYKTISHNLTLPENDDIICIKNYLKLRAKITTIRKVNAIEQTSILNAIYSKIYENFNMRKVDFGEEIPYDSILDCISNADTRIKSVSLEEPEIITRYCKKDGTEVDAPSDETTENVIGKQIHNKLVLNNVLAGRVPLFKYDENFKPSFTEINYPSWTEGGQEQQYREIYPENNKEIESIEPKFIVNSSALGGDGLKLKENEVVQFRLQNLKTLVTYPAYVNYFIHLNDDRSVEAINATMQKLSDFLDTQNADADNELWWVTAANSGSFTLVQDEYDDTFESKWKKAFNLVDDAYVLVNNPTAGTSYYHLSIQDENNSTWTWHNWLQSLTVTYKDGNNETKTKSGVRDLFSILKKDNSRNAGKLVDREKNIYRAFIDSQDKSSAGSSYFDIWNTQITHEQTVLPSTGTQGYTWDGLGQDAILSGIAKNEEYELQNGEYLLINYTSSETYDEEEVKTKINKVHEAGTIIKPNFELIDSIKYRTLHSYSKTEGYDFTGLIPSDMSNPDGMFSLGTDEQIEIRDFVKVELDEQCTNIYWTRNDEDMYSNNDGEIEFKFTDEFVEDSAGPDIHNGVHGYFLSYTLKDGEYLYYTNKDMIDLAYYGSGTKIERTKYTPRIVKYKQDEQTDPDDIASYGLAAGIPWRAYNFGKTEDSHEQKLVLSEYKYVNLTNEDTLVNVTPKSGSSISQLNNEWLDIDNAEYDVGTGVTPLGRVTFVSKNVSWQVRTKLELNVGPNAIQTLHNNDTDAWDEIKINFRDAQSHVAAGSETLKNHEVDGAWHNISLKTNELIQYSTANSYSTIKKEFYENGQLKSDYSNTQIKVFKYNQAKDATNGTLNLGNFGNGDFTKVSCSSAKGTENPIAKINTNIANDRLGLLMIYYVSINDSGTDAYITLADDEKELKIFNNDNSWWDGLVDTSEEVTKYILKRGLNIIQIDESNELSIWPDENKEDIIIFGNLDIVYRANESSAAGANYTAMLNPKLKYFAEGNTQSEYAKAMQALSDIDILDGDTHEFYYNNLVANSTAIDLNSSDEDDDLLNPRSYYDYNNRNNKFVISEIDADYLTTGITIAKSCKL